MYTHLVMSDLDSMEELGRLGMLREVQMYKVGVRMGKQARGK